MKFLDTLKARTGNISYPPLLQKVPAEIREQRLAICHECEHFTKFHRCKQCGCFMDAKTWLAQQECPVQKWGVHQIDVTDITDE